MDNEKIWYVVREKKADGPFTQSELLLQIKENKLSFDDLVYRPGLEGWTSISECKEFDRRDEFQILEVTATGVEIPKETELQGWILLARKIEPDNEKSNYVQSGPFDAEVIRQQLNNGTIKYDDFVWKVGFRDWTAIGKLDEFDRRRPKDLLEMTPKPEAAAPPPKPTVSNVPDIKFFNEDEPVEISNAGKTHVPVPNMGGEDEPSGMMGRIVDRFQPTIIALTGVALGVLVTVVTLKAYFGDKHPKPVTQVVYQNPPMPPPSTEVVKGPPPPPPPVVAKVNDEKELQTGFNLALKVTDLNTAKFSFENNLPEGTQITLEVKGEPGQILKFKKYFLKRVLVATGKPLPIDLKDQRLPSGTYQMQASALEQKTDTAFFIGKKDRIFNTALSTFQKVVRKQKMNEEKTIDSTFKFIDKSIAQFPIEYKKSAKKSKPLASKSWRGYLTRWQKQYVITMKSFQNLKVSKPFDYIYIDELSEMKNLGTRLGKLAQIYDKRFKVARNLASDAVPSAKLEVSLGEFKQKWAVNKRK